MRFNLGHGIDGNTNNNQQGGAAKEERYIKLIDQNGWQYTDHTDIDSADNSQPNHDLIDKISSFLAGTNTGDETAVLFQIIGNVNRIEGYRSVKETEKDDKDYIQQGMQGAAPGSAMT